jgi:predicted RNase H-like nuclease
LKFVGIDLAWGEEKPSGVAVIDSEGVVQRADAKLLGNAEICQFAGLDSPEATVVAIDAPLIVQNTMGQRPVEVQLTSIFGRYDAGPHSSNRSKPNFQETGRVQRMVKLLGEQGFSQQSKIQKQEPQRSFVEVFPAPALVMLFPCHLHTAHTHCRPPRYKHKSGRDWSELYSEWEIYRARLRSLEGREPALTLSPAVKDRMSIDIGTCTGTAYKYFDDLLDGILCAYLAYYFWYWGEEACWVVGDLETGYVTLPKCRLKNCPLHTDPPG